MAALRAQKKIYLEKRNQKDRAKFADERKQLKQSLLNFQLKLEQNSDDEEEKVESHQQFQIQHSVRSEDLESLPSNVSERDHFEMSEFKQSKR